jgi:hypothetical protein
MHHKSLQPLEFVGTVRKEFDRVVCGRNARRGGTECLSEAHFNNSTSGAALSAPVARLGRQVKIYFYENESPHSDAAGEKHAEERRVLREAQIQR